METFPVWEESRSSRRFFFGDSVAGHVLLSGADRSRIACRGGGVQRTVFRHSGRDAAFLRRSGRRSSGLSYKPKFVAQILVGVLLIYGGVGIENLGGLFGLYHIPSSVGWVLTVLVTVLLVNAYNLIDGIDGLCSGLALLALGAFGGWFCWNHLYVYGDDGDGHRGRGERFFLLQRAGTPNENLHGRYRAR